MNEDGEIFKFCVEWETNNKMKKEARGKKVGKIKRLMNEPGGS